MNTETYEVTIETFTTGNRYEYWRQNGQYHRANGPAVIITYAGDGRYEQWYQNGKPHRLDGPAAIRSYADGTCKESWYRDGNRIDPPKEEEDPCAGRVVNIDGREYRLEPVTGG